MSCDVMVVSILSTLASAGVSGLTGLLGLGPRPLRRRYWPASAGIAGETAQRIQLLLQKGIAAAG